MSYFYKSLIYKWFKFVWISEKINTLVKYNYLNIKSICIGLNMLNLVKITVFSLVVSVGAFANGEEMNQVTDSQGISLQEANSDNGLFSFIGNAIKGAVNLGKNLLGLGSSVNCDDVKKQVDPDKKMSSQEEKEALQAAAKSSDCTAANQCDKEALGKIIKDCY